MQENKISFGLSEQTIHAIKCVFHAHHSIEKVVIYGSRTKGNFKNGSDIDLTIISASTSTDELILIANELDDLMLPYKIDLSLMRQIENNDLLDHIQRIGIIFYQRKPSK